MRNSIALMASLLAPLTHTMGKDSPDNTIRPNVIVILTDDQGFGDVSLHGNPVVKTLHTDAIAQDGVSFSQFHVTPMCSPTRAALLTGKKPIEKWCDRNVRRLPHHPHRT